LVVQGARVEVRAAQARFTVQAYDAEPVAYVSVQRGSATVRARLGANYGKAVTLRAGERVRVGPGDRIERVDVPVGALDLSTAATGASAPQAIAPSVAATELASASATLSEAIQRDIGQPVSEIRLTGRDTVDVLFWNPTFWWKDDTLQALPEASLPAVRQAATRTAEYLWDRYGRNAGIAVIRITFRRDYYELVPGARRQRPGQEVITQFTRQQLEAGKLDAVRLTIVPRI